MNKGLFIALIFSVFPALAQEGDAKIIQYMDFLQHRELVQKQELVKFYAQLAPKPSSRATAQTQNTSSDSIATEGSSK